MPACGYVASDEAADGFARFVRQGGRLPGYTGPGQPITVTYSYSNFLDGGLKDPTGVSVRPNCGPRTTFRAASTANGTIRCSSAIHGNGR